MPLTQQLTIQWSYFTHIKDKSKPSEVEAFKANKIKWDSDIIKGMGVSGRTFVAKKLAGLK